MFLSNREERRLIYLLDLERTEQAIEEGLIKKGSISTLPTREELDLPEKMWPLVCGPPRLPRVYDRT